MCVIRMNCPQCQVALEVPGALAGQSGECPRCGARLQIPAQSSASREADARLLEANLADLQKPLDAESLANVCGLTQAYIVCRVMAGSREPLLGDAYFFGVARAFRDEFLENRPLSWDSQKIQERLTARLEGAGEQVNLFAAVSQVAHIVSFAAENENLMRAFRQAGMPQFDKVSRECIAYLYRDYPQPALCLHHVCLRHRARSASDPSCSLQDWHMIGRCCTLLGRADGVSLARAALQRLGREDLAEQWDA
jgi:hypothetical protein